MKDRVYFLPERMPVEYLLRVLKGTPFHGFPIISVDGLNEDPPKPYFAGFILRRQLLVLLREKVWKLAEGAPLPEAAVRHFVDSAFTSTADFIAAVESVELTSSDLSAPIDFRPYMDPSPYVVSDLMPLRRVYRYFNEIGVRHLTVIDCREEVVGIITRKDIIAESIEETWYSKGSRLVEKLQARGGNARASKPADAAEGPSPTRRSTFQSRRDTGSAVAAVAIRCDPHIPGLQLLRRRNPESPRFSSAPNTPVERSSSRSRVPRPCLLRSASRGPIAVEKDLEEESCSAAAFAAASAD